MTSAVDDLIFAGAAAQADAMAAGSTTSRALAEACLARIERLDSQLNAFNTLFRDEALRAADEADARRGRGETAPLLGVPIAIKDDVDQAGQRTTFGTAVGEVAQEESEVLKRLRAAGAVVVGRTNAPELLIFPFTESKTYGATRNPWDADRTPGGSSGGSAAAVASGMVGLALGSDGGGSIRIPATCCGIFGLKPTRDLIPTAPHSDADHGWEGLGVYGPLSRTVKGAALFMDATADAPSGDSFAKAAESDPGKLRIVIATKPPLPGPVKRQTIEATRQTADVLRSLGHTVADGKPPIRPLLLNFIPRYVKGIQRSGETLGQAERFEARTRGMMRLGRLTPEWVVARARRREAMLYERVEAFLADADVLLMPGLAAPPLRVGKFEKRGALFTFNGVANFTPFTALWNTTGQPGAAVPVKLDGSGLPLGVQLIGRRGADRQLLSLAAQLEREQPWADRRPPVS
jgi:amidase